MRSHLLLLSVSCLIWIGAISGVACSQTPIHENGDRAIASFDGSLANRIPLLKNWVIQNSDSVRARAELISKPGFSTAQWIGTSVPSTILGALLIGRSEDPFFGMNMLDLPGSGPYYVPGKSYSEVETSKDSPFGHPWWYRTEFTLPAGINQKNIDLHFDGLNYAAEIWLNGHLIAGTDSVAGTYRTYSFDVTRYLIPGEPNALAVLMSPPMLADLTPSWVDWNPTPQDKNMGILRPVYLIAHGSVSVAHPQVITHLDLPDTTHAELSIETDLSNSTSQAVTGELRGTIEGISFSKSLTLSAGETRDVVLSSDEFPQLVIQNPRLWWPVAMGKPELYGLNLEFIENGSVSDQKKIRFGIRQVDSKLTAEGSRLYLINGKPIQIRGGGWASDLYLRFSKERAIQELNYALDLRLNTLRLEGDLQPDEFYELTDKYGILVMPGWVCCNAWQESKHWHPKNFAIAQESLRDQIYKLRAHPSVFTFLYGSDTAPPKNVEKIYLDTFKNYHWPDPVLSSAAAVTTPGGGKSGVKMNGPYDYVPPSYWYVDKNRAGGAWGFSTEISPGASIPPIESLRMFIPQEHLWPIDEYWNFHANEEDFANIDRYTSALSKRYGEAQSAEEFALKSQVMGYDSHRAMFEAYGKNKYHSATGVIQWMLNNAWPSLNWHLYDYYLRCGGTYFGVKKANEPLHIQYSYDDHTIFVVNGTYHEASNLLAHIEVFDSQMNPLFSRTKELNAPADSSTEVLALRNLHLSSKLYFVKLSLDDENHSRVSDNFYWLSTQNETFDWDKTTYMTTPVLQEGDLTELNHLKPVTLSVSSQFDSSGHSGRVTLSNPGSSLAFFVHLKLSHAGGEIQPLWRDNYISLIPGETRVIDFQVGPDVELAAGSSLITVEGWNLLQPSKD